MENGERMEGEWGEYGRTMEGKWKENDRRMEGKLRRVRNLPNGHPEEVSLTISVSSWCILS